MAHRHKHHKAHGGGTKEPFYEGGESNTGHEAKSRENKNRGGKVVKRASGGKVPGYKAGGRLDKRARGGGVGADKHPFSSAHIKGHMGPASHPAAHKG